MKMLAIADIHGSKKALDSILLRIQQYNPELVIVCGDITQFGPPEWAFEFLNSIPLKILAIPGNCDPIAVLKVFDHSNAINLHCKKVTVDNNIFIGMGGSNPTPFRTPFELSEQKIFECLDPIMESNAILITHAPAYGHLDKVSIIGHQGSRSIAEIVQKYHPRLHISAHIHEARGVERNSTVFVNPGAASKNYAALIELQDEIEITMLG